jgi:titin
VLWSYDSDASNNAAPGYQSVDLSFSAPANTGGTPITSYTIMYSLDPSFVNNVQSVSVNGTDAEIQDANLVIPYADRSTVTGWFYFKVCAVNAVGAGPFTSAVTIVAEIVPNAVTNLAASNLDANGNHAPSTITISWNYDIDNSTPLLGYIIAYLDTAGEMTSVYVNNVSGSPSHTISGLQNGVSYDFSVFGINMLGAGPSLDVSCIPSTVPDAPDLSAVHSNDAITLSWFEPYDEGSAVTGYKIYRALGPNGNFYLLHTAQANDASYTDSSLINGSIYRYEITGINANGEGPRSSTAVEYPSTVPDAPVITGLANSNSQDIGGQLTLSWSQAPADVAHNGGDVIIQFDVKDANSNLLGSVMAHTGTSNYSFPINNLINGQSYTFSVCAVNRDGEGALATSAPAVPSGLPDAPSGLSITNGDPQGAGGLGIINVNALNVASGGSNVRPSDEGSAFQMWQIYRDGVAMEQFVGTQYNYGNLVNGQLYNFALAAINGNGEGAQCAQVSFIPSCEPDAPTNVAVSHGNHQAIITWDPLAVAPSNVASDEGSPIQQYQIQMSSDGGANWADVGGCASNVSSFTKMGLINGHSYDFRVSALNANGMSAPSAHVSVVPSNSPSAVRNVHIVANASELQIIWDEPTMSGGLPYDYSIEVVDGSGGIAYQGTQSSRYVEIQNLATNVQYTVTIYAFNNVDTNYVMYSAQSTTVPSPIEVTSLEWDNTQPNSSIMKWNYNSDVYAVIDFLLVIMDVTTGVFSSVFVPAHNAVPDETITQGQNGNYSYTFALTSLNTETVSMNSAADSMKVMAFARNADGISGMSNVALVR